MLIGVHVGFSLWFSCICWGSYKHFSASSEVHYMSWIHFSTSLKSLRKYCLFIMQGLVDIQLDFIYQKLRIIAVIFEGISLFFFYCSVFMWWPNGITWEMWHHLQIFYRYFSLNIWHPFFLLYRTNLLITLTSVSLQVTLPHPFLSCTFGDFTLWALALCSLSFVTMACWLFAEYSKYTPTSEPWIAFSVWEHLHTALQLPNKSIQASQFHCYPLWLSFSVP